MGAIAPIGSIVTPCLYMTCHNLIGKPIRTTIKFHNIHQLNDKKSHFT